MQPTDFTTLSAVRSNLEAHWLPARCEQVYQRDRFTIFMALRTIERRGWLAISWHPQAARIHIAEAPPKQPDTFTFSQQLKHQLGGLALTQIRLISPWERTLDLQFARRPDEPALWHLYVEVMGKYSNVILTTDRGQIVTAAHQVSEQQSSVRPIQTGQPYVPPPKIKGPFPQLDEPFESWRDSISLIPGKLKKMMVKAYSGVSSAVAGQLIETAGLGADSVTTDLDETGWKQLFGCWCDWLTRLEKTAFEPAFTATGYTVLGIGTKPLKPVANVQVLLDEYYQFQFNREEFRRLHHQISQCLKNRLKKLRQKAATFEERLQQSDQSEDFREKADLLMAHLHEWQPGMKTIELIDFETEQPVVLSLNPEKNAVQNAQMLYKQHQKLKRARVAVEPLLAEVSAEINYLEQVEDSVLQMPTYKQVADLRSLQEVQTELISQNYLKAPVGHPLEKGAARKGDAQSGRQGEQMSFRRFQLPQGFEVLVGRNNNQNEQLTFKQATDYDLWLHAQEIPGSHVLLRLDAGEVPSDEALQLAADLAAFYSRGRQSDQVPVVYTEPRHVYKPKGALPGMVIYKKERILWGKPRAAEDLISDLGGKA